MSDHSSIEWCDATWNPTVGCSKVSPGCASCYAIKDVHRMAGNPNEKIRAANEGLTRKLANGMLDWTGEVRTAFANRLVIPLRASRPRKYFVNSGVILGRYGKKKAGRQARWPHMERISPHQFGASNHVNEKREEKSHALPTPETQSGAVKESCRGLQQLRRGSASEHERY
jgi:protein gp37